MKKKLRNPVRTIGFMIIGIAALFLGASALFLDGIPTGVLATNLAMAGMGVVFVAIGGKESDPEE